MIAPLTNDQAPLHRRPAEMRAVLERWFFIYRQDDTATLKAGYEAVARRSIAIENAEGRGSYLGVGGAPGADDYVADKRETLTVCDAQMAAFNDDQRHARYFAAIRHELLRNGNLR